MSLAVQWLRLRHAGGQYRANCEVAGTPYIYKKCACAECRPVEPYTTMFAEQGKNYKQFYTFGSPVCTKARGQYNRLLPVSQNSNRFRPAAAKTWLFGGFG